MLKIAIVVHGRFHAFDLARELLARGHDVVVFTNYPRSVAAAFGIPRGRTRSFLAHGVLSRVVGRVPGRWIGRVAEPGMHRVFGRWAARALRERAWDVVHCWSGASEELLTSTAIDAGSRLLMRGSAHIEEQSRLLETEERRAGVALDRPSRWMRARELREYALADGIVVLSTFARASFESHPAPHARLDTLLLGVQSNAFRPPVDIVAARRRRLMSGEPMRVLYCGAVSYRKGFLDLMCVMQRLAGEPFRFSIVGEALPEVRRAIANLPASVDVVGKLPQADLPQRYWNADLFLFPTIEDGFPTVLAQAKAAALPIVTTLHGAGADIVTSERDGFLVPVRDPDAIVERLRWCDAHRPALAAMVTDVYDRYRPRDWADVAEDFEQICLRARRRDASDHSAGEVADLQGATG